MVETEEELHRVGDAELQLEGEEVGVAVPVPALPKDAEGVPECVVVEVGVGSAVPVVVGQALGEEEREDVGVVDAVLLMDTVLLAVCEAEALTEGVSIDVVLLVMDCSAEEVALGEAEGQEETVCVEAMVASPTTVTLALVL